MNWESPSEATSITWAFSIMHIYIYTLYIWVCLKMGYTPNYSHLVGIMISKTIGCRGTLFSDKPIYIYTLYIYTLYIYTLYIYTYHIITITPLNHHSITVNIPRKFLSIRRCRARDRSSSSRSRMLCGRSWAAMGYKSMLAPNWVCVYVSLYMFICIIMHEHTCIHSYSYNFKIIYLYTCVIMCIYVYIIYPKKRNNMGLIILQV